MSFRNGLLHAAQHDRVRVPCGQRECRKPIDIVLHLCPRLLIPAQNSRIVVACRQQAPSAKQKSYRQQAQQQVSAGETAAHERHHAINQRRRPEHHDRCSRPPISCTPALVVAPPFSCTTEPLVQLRFALEVRDRILQLLNLPLGAYAERRPSAFFRPPALVLDLEFSLLFLADARNLRMHLVQHAQQLINLILVLETAHLLHAAVILHKQTGSACKHTSDTAGAFFYKLKCPRNGGKRHIIMPVNKITVQI